MKASVKGNGATRVPRCCAVGLDAELAVIEAKPRFCRTISDIVLSGSAVSKVVLLHVTSAITITRATLVYSAASSADITQVAIALGKESDDNFFCDTTSLASKAEWYEQDMPLLNCVLDAGDTLIAKCAGGKVGVGTVQIWVEYTVN